MLFDSCSGQQCGAGSVSSRRAGGCGAVMEYRHFKFCGFCSWLPPSCSWFYAIPLSTEHHHFHPHCKPIVLQVLIVIMLITQATATLPHGRAEVFEVSLGASSLDQSFPSQVDSVFGRALIEPMGVFQIPNMAYSALEGTVVSCG